jgi:serine/threonine-protein kinase
METRSLGRYHLLAELGRGAIGTVYRAADPLTKREVAIKTLHPTLPEDVMREVRERFLLEAKSAGRLNHPNIVSVYDVGEQGDIAYIAMELLEGRSLHKMLRDPGPLPFHMIAELAAQAADGLDHAQRFAIVHRDVKPANVVVSLTGQAKLTDFGVPSLVMTQAGTVIGSPRYMSPEQVLAQPVDPRSDIFSLGVVLYEMLTRRTPFERPGETHLFSLMSRIARDPYQPVTQLDPEIPPAFDRVLARALAKNPNERYSRAGEMAKDLRNLRNQAGRGAAGAGVHEDAKLVPADARKTADASAPVASFPRAAPAAPASPSGPGAAGAGAHGDAKLVPANARKTANASAPAASFPRAAPAAPASPSGPGGLAPDFLAGLDAFSRKVDEEQRAHERAEAEQRRGREEEETRRKAEAERARQAQAQGKAEAEKQGEGRRFAAIEMLRKQAASRPAAADTAPRRAEAKVLLNKTLLSTLHYLAEFAKELNGVLPTTQGPYGFIYLQQASPMVLSSAFADYRLCKVDGDEVCEQIFLTYQARYAQPAAVDVAGPDIEHCRRFLALSRVPFEFSVLKKNDFGQAVSGRFALSRAIPCEIHIRGDYDAPGFVVELLNVGRIGTGSCRLAPDAFNERVVDEIAKHALGAKSEFAKLVTR